MNPTSWLTNLLRTRKRNQLDTRTSLRRQQTQIGWSQVELLENRTLLSAVNMGSPLDSDQDPVTNSADTDGTVEQLEETATFVANLQTQTDTDLTISKHSSEVWVTQGALHTYTVTVANEGGLAVDDAVVSDNATPFLENVAWAATFSGGATGASSGSGSLNQTVVLPAGSSITYTISGVVRSDIPDNMTNVATISSAETPDSDPSNNHAFDSDLIILAADEGSGYFVSQSAISASYSGGWYDIELGDLNNDGHLDAVLAGNVGTQIFRNNGSGHLSLMTSLPVQAVGIKLGDLDNDGNLDLFVTAGLDSPEGDQVWLNTLGDNWNGPQLWVFRDSGQRLGNYMGRAVKLGDLDGDGDLDAFVTTKSNTLGDVVWLNDGNGNFVNSGQSIAPSPDAERWGVDLGDLDGDGDLDAFITNSNGADFVYKNAGDGTFFQHQQLDLFASGKSRLVNLGDVDSDGDLDAVVMGSEGMAYLMENDGTGTFSTGQELPIPGSVGWEGKFADFDADGDLDIYMTSDALYGTYIWLNNGEGHFTPSGQTYKTGGQRGLAFGDIDGDSDIDVIAAASKTGLSFIYRNQNIEFPYATDFEGGHWGGLYVENPQNASVVAETSSNHTFQLDNSSLTGLSTALLANTTPLPDYFEMSVKATSLSGDDRWADGFLIFDYQHDNDFKYAGYLANQNEWVIGHYQGNFGNRIATIDWDALGKTIDTERAYQMHVRIDGNQVTLHVDGLLVTTATFAGGIGNGKAGLAAYNAVTRFDYFKIAESVDTRLQRSFPFKEDFEDGVAEGFQSKPNNGWDIVDTPDGKVLQVDNAANSNLGLMSVPLEKNIPSTYEMSARINSRTANSGWRNGFIIFDYKSDTDFKYAGFFTGQSEWIIGHYQGNFNNRLVTVDWDDTGRNIETDKFYTLHVRIDRRSNGQNVWLSVDGEFIAYAKFAPTVTSPVVGVAAERALTWFDDFQVAARVEAGAPSDLPYIEDYNDGVANQFDFHNSRFWSIRGTASDRYLQINASGSQGLGVGYLENQFPLPETYDISASVTSITGSQRWLDGFIVFDYHSPTDFKYAGMFTGHNQWVIGHYQGDWTNRVAQVDWDDVGQRIDRNKAILLHVAVDGNDVTLRANGIEVVSGTFASFIGDGTVGVAADNAVTQFDDFHVAVNIQKGNAFSLPYSEDFEDGAAEDFFVNRNPNVWGFANYGDNKVLRVNSSNGGGNSVQYLPIQNPDGDAIRISADIRSNPSTNWADGFLIFDYKGENDFKYAGFFTGHNEWIIGHYKGNYNDYRLTTVDWDDEGRQINFGQFYHLEVALENDIATLFVDGELISEGDFNVNITGGPVGLAAGNAFTWFDNFQVDFLPQGNPTSDSLFANWDEESDGLLI